jgi:sugar phosphate permease
MDAMSQFEQPTRIRYEILAVSVLMAFVLYLHRVSLGEIAKDPQFIAEFGQSKEGIGRVLGAFFFAYALFQIPAGWVSDRFGGRKMLTTYIFVWSLLTGWTGLVSSLSGLLLARLAFGVAQAGAYPTSGAIIRNWFPFQNRGLASGLVSMGGRVGGAMSPFLATWLILQTGSWRTTLMIFAALGMLVAALYWQFVRDRPAAHHRTTPADVAFSGVSPEREPLQLKQFPTILLSCVRSRSLWASAFVQFATNVGWSFLITWLPTYLKEVKEVEPLTGAKMLTFILALGIPAQIVGGAWSDWSVRRFGLRWGRVMPTALTSLVAGIAYFSCLGFDSVWGVVVCCAVVSVMTDLANPTAWAFAQDVGGKETATVFGWCNMMGNLGAATSAVIIPYLMIWGKDSGYGTAPVFVMCGTAFLCCSLAVLGMDATKEIVRREA